MRHKKGKSLPDENKATKKKTRKGESLLLVIAGGVFILSAVWLWQMWRGYESGEEEYRELQAMAVQERPVESREEEENLNSLQEPEGSKEEEDSRLVPLGDYRVKEIDFESLQEENGEICGWLELPGLEISYPVVQGEDNEYYLKRTFRKEANGAGSIFMDMRNSRELTDRNTIIYGHNMKNGSMFGKLKQYREEEVLRENPVFYYYTPGHVYQCQIISCRTVRAKESEYPTGFGDEESYEKYIEKIEKESWHKCGFEADTGDRLMMLSTCTGSRTERFVIQAKILEISNDKNK